MFSRIKDTFTGHKRYRSQSVEFHEEDSEEIMCLKTRRYSDTVINHSNTRITRLGYQFSDDDVVFSLYGKTVVQPIDTERIQRKRKKPMNQWQQGSEIQALPCVGYHPTLLDDNDYDKDRIDINPTNAVMSFIPQVQLCISSLPGYDFGVCARQHIPHGTIIGPYKGRRVKPEDLKMVNGNSMAFLWEIYKNGAVDHYIDGSDEDVSCWMRFVRSARNRKEQNLCAVQYEENIYYRTLNDISIGTELLVWYEEGYEEEYFGIPVELSGKTHHKERKMTSSSTLQLQTLSPNTMKQLKKTRVWLDLSITNNESMDSSTEHSNKKRQRFRDVFSPSQKDQKRPGIESYTEDLRSILWKCNQCNETFTQRSLLRLHVCSVQTNQPFDCGHCTLSFSDANKLRAHVSTHANERLFKCGYCARRFAGATTLANHVRAHTGEKPFSCEKCGKCFTQASQLSRHQRIIGDCLN